MVDVTITMASKTPVCISDLTPYMKGVHCQFMVIEKGMMLLSVHCAKC